MTVIRLFFDEPLSLPSVSRIAMRRGVLVFEHIYQQWTMHHRYAYPDWSKDPRRYSTKHFYPSWNSIGLRCSKTLQAPRNPAPEGCWKQDNVRFAVFHFISFGSVRIVPSSKIQHAWTAIEKKQILSGAKISFVWQSNWSGSIWMPFSFSVKFDASKFVLEPDESWTWTLRWIVGNSDVLASRPSSSTVQILMQEEWKMLQLSSPSIIAFVKWNFVFITTPVPVVDFSLLSITIQVRGKFITTYVFVSYFW